MGWQILKQPDGLFAVFSSISETIILWDATRDVVISYYMMRENEDAYRRIKAWLDEVENNSKRNQFEKSWEECLESTKERDPELYRRIAKEKK